MDEAQDNTNKYIEIKRPKITKCDKSTRNKFSFFRRAATLIRTVTVCRLMFDFAQKVLIQPCATKKATKVMLHFAALSSLCQCGQLESVSDFRKHVHQLRLLAFSLASAVLMKRRSVSLLAFLGTCFATVCRPAGGLSFRESGSCFASPRRRFRALSVPPARRLLAYQENCSATFSRPSARRRSTPISCRETYSGSSCRRRLPAAVRRWRQPRRRTVRPFPVSRGSCS